MKIDRHLFLVLTGTLAAVACGADPAPPPVTPAVDPTPPPVMAAADPTPPPPAPTVEASVAPTPPPPKPDPKTITNNDESGCGTTSRKFNDAKTKCSDDKGGAVNCKAVAMGYSATEGCQSPSDLVEACDSYKKP